MKERYLFLNTYYFNLSQVKECNRAILNHFFFNTDFDSFDIHSYVIALSLFTDQKNFRNDTFNIEDYKFLNDILDDFFNGNDNSFTISRDQLKTIIKLCNNSRLSVEDNERVIREYIARNEDCKDQLDTLLDINQQI